MPNVSFAIEDGSRLPFRMSNSTWFCLTLFPDPVRGLSEFRGVLREGRTGGRFSQYCAAASVYHARGCHIGRHAPERAATSARYFPLGKALVGTFRRWRYTTPRMDVVSWPS